MTDQRADEALRAELAAARARILACAAAGPDAVRRLVAGAANVTAAVDLRTGEALTARVALPSAGGTRIWYDTLTGRLNGVAGTCYRTLPLGDRAAAGLVGDAAWHPAAASPDAMGAA